MFDPPTMMPGSVPRRQPGDLEGILSRDIDAQLQFYRVGRDVNAAASAGNAGL